MNDTLSPVSINSQPFFTRFASKVQNLNAPLLSATPDNTLPLRQVSSDMTAFTGGLHTTVDALNKAVTDATSTFLQTFPLVDPWTQPSSSMTNARNGLTRNLWTIGPIGSQIDTRA
ncbi:hypothetical protein [Paludibacterium yongneupense]|uniref:hypothetical protein n=1 Tax=Paludibacterium yongneupense TaxID=400061 RepID=UPI000416A0AB|nr:hypothetical protein [Paludibacterium yongneupense]